MPAEIEPLLLELRAQINHLIDRLVERTNAGGGGRRRAVASDDTEQAALDALTRALLALLHDALVEPLPPPPKPPKLMEKRSRSRKTRRRRR